MQSMGTTICLADREDVEDYIKNVLIGTGIVVSVTGEDYVAPAPVNPNTKNKNETGMSAIAKSFIIVGVVFALMSLCPVIGIILSIFMSLLGGTSITIPPIVILIVSLIVFILNNALAILIMRKKYPVVVYGTVIAVKGDAETSTPVYRYTYKGKEHRYRSRLSTSGKKWIGEVVPLRIKEAEPEQVCDGRGMFLIVFIVNILAGTMALGAVLHSGTAIVLSFVVLIISGPLQKLIYNKLLFWE